ncbi:MAG: FAD-binding oxidoreductase [Bacteroidia bacterium]|nr:FAD-binding oxidoreductase [Bacteroidia bacterium]
MRKFEDNLNLERREFIRLLAIGATGIFLSACGIDPDKNSTDTDQNEKPKPKKDSVPLSENKTDEPLISNENVTFIKKGDLQYEELRHGHNKRFNKFPAIIALCENEKGVVHAINYAKKNNLPVAVKSGGHSLEGLSANDGGMVINLSKFKTIEYLENDQINLGPASTLAELYATLLPEGKILPGGSCGGVAVAGLSLGGGYGMYARKWGLTCDHLLEVTMVDGKGNLVNSKDDPELLWACRGGGSGNFGVITSMKFQTHKAPATMTSHRFRKFKTSAEDAADLMSKWFDLTKDLPHSCFSVFIVSSKTCFILFTNFEKETEEVKNIVEQFSALTEKVSLGKPQKLESAVQNFYGVQTPVYAKNSSVGLYKDFEELRSFIIPTIEKIQNTPGMLLSIGTLGGKIDDAEFEKGSAFPHRKFHYLSELQTYWKKEEQGEKMINAYQEVRDIFQNNGIKREYFNYPDLGFKNWETAYYGENYSRLQQVKKKYDPENLIRHEQSIKLPS